MKFVLPTGRWVAKQLTEGLDLGTREDGRVERYCKHGIGHTIGHISKWTVYMAIHGCDGCCSQWGEDGLE